MEQQALSLTARGDANDTDTLEDSLMVPYEAELLSPQMLKIWLSTGGKEGFRVGSSEKEQWTWMLKTKFQDLPYKLSETKISTSELCPRRLRPDSAISLCATTDGFQNLSPRLVRQCMESK